MQRTCAGDRFGQSRKRETRIDSDDKRSSERNGGKTCLENQIYKNTFITAFTKF